VPIGSADVAVDAVTVDGQPASLVLREAQLAALIAGPGKKKIALTAKRPIASDAGVAHFDLPLAVSPINTLTVTVPGPVDIRAFREGTYTRRTETMLPVLSRRAMRRFHGAAPAAGGGGEASLFGRAASASAGGSSLRDDTAHPSSGRPVHKVRSIPGVLLSVTGRHRELRGGCQRCGPSPSTCQPLENRDLVLVYEKDVPDAGGPTPIFSPAVDGAGRAAA
jgi:hypothetical protein